MKIIKRLSYWTVFILIFAIFNAPAWARPIAKMTYLETYLGTVPLPWQYEYIFSNDSDGINDLYSVTFYLDSSVEFSPVAMPDGWAVIPPSDALTDFIFTTSTIEGTPPEGNDIAPGTSLSGFNFLFNEQVGDLVFLAYFTNPCCPSCPIQYAGTSTPVPLPATIWLLAGGVIGLKLVRQKKFKTPT